jgi:hypothetical protein
LKRSKKKDKISKGHTGLKQSEEAKEKWSVAKLGILNPNYGKKTWNFGIPRTKKNVQKKNQRYKGGSFKKLFEYFLNTLYGQLQFDERL